MNQLVSKAFIVGWPGHDPGTYGLKGPLSISFLPLVLRHAAKLAKARELRVNRPASFTEEDMGDLWRRWVGP